MKTILIIDDEKQIRKIISNALRDIDYEILEASNGKLGMAIIREMPIELVITDIIMPEQEGIETIIKLRQEFPETRIIAISGGGAIGSESYLSLARKLDVHATLSKPFSLEKLLSTVKEVLGE